MNNEEGDRTVFPALLGGRPRAARALPDFNAGTVVEHAIALILAVTRRLFESTMLMKAGYWPLGAVIAGGIYDLQGKTVGIIGMGKIGREVAKRLRPFGVRILYSDKQQLSTVEEASLEAEYVSLGHLLAESDIVSLHAPLTPESHGMLGRPELELMKPGTLLINTARGALVDETALAELLRDGKIAGAGIDVFAGEPPDPKHPLRGYRNAVLTPHAAGQTREAMDRMVEMMLENITASPEGRNSCTESSERAQTRFETAGVAGRC
jgi:phosphoglycerate dehydrogenase-like enzyme